MACSEMSMGRGRSKALVRRSLENVSVAAKELALCLSTTSSGLKTTAFP